MNPYLFVCTECLSDQSLNPEKNLWVQNGQTPPCKYCGGIVIYIEAETKEELAEARKRSLMQYNRQRGLQLYLTSLLPKYVYAHAR